MLPCVHAPVYVCVRERVSSLSSVETVPTAPVALLDRSICHRVSGSQAAVMRCVSEPAVGLRRGRDGGLSLFW